MTVRRWALAAGVVAVVLTLAVVVGLRYNGSRRIDCTLIGSEPSNVSVRLESPGWIVTEFCVGDECEAADRVSTGSDPGVYPFQATLAAPDGSVVVHSGEVSTFEVWPNGEGCGSRRAYGQVVIGSDGTATTLNPWVSPPPF